jgi:hypothetical protein
MGAPAVVAFSGGSRPIALSLEDPIPGPGTVGSSMACGEYGRDGIVPRRSLDGEAGLLGRGRVLKPNTK